jgi:hypothetical protein
MGLLGSKSLSDQRWGGYLCGSPHSAMRAIESALKNVSPDAHWIARHLATAGGKRIKMRLLSMADTVDTTPSARQQELYLYSVRQPASSHATCAASAKPTRALPTGKNLCSASFTSAPVHQQPSAEKLDQLPTCCPPNPACCHLGALAFSWHNRPFSGPAFPHRLQRLPSASCQPACIFNERG